MSKLPSASVIKENESKINESSVLPSMFYGYGPLDQTAK